MVRQVNTAVEFDKTSRIDTCAIMTSGRAGQVTPFGYIPLLRGDSMAGSVSVDIELGEMPRPLLNGVQANIQAWFVPKSMYPQFSGYDEFMNSYQDRPIKQLGAADRTPPKFFGTIAAPADITTFANSRFAQTLGIHVQAGVPINTDLINAYQIVYNFRLASYSNKLARRPYAEENFGGSLQPNRAFWPTDRFSRVVADYEKALIVGALDLDVSAGRVPVSGIGYLNEVGAGVARNVKETGGEVGRTGYRASDASTLEGGSATVAIRRAESGLPAIYAEMAATRIVSSLNDIDAARTTQAYANMRKAMAGAETTGFSNGDVIIAELLQGFSVPESHQSRPWLLDSKVVGFGFAERHATDAANLDKSVTQGRVSATLSLNVPAQDVGGMVIFAVEVLPERLVERQSDEFLSIISTNALPDALRDVQRTEPVDMVLNRRIDAKHATPSGLYGYEPMNDVWNREAVRLGGAFYQATPGAAWTEQRSAIWIAEVVNPTYTQDHFLAPANFPHDVFADENAPAFELVARHSCTIVGLTQIGDVLSEDNQDYLRTKLASA